MSGTHGQPVAADAREHRSRTATTAPPHQRRAYNDAAATYDAERYESTEGKYFNDLELAILEQWLQPRPGLKLLELPAGTGRVAVPLALKGATVVGGDISENMLRVAHDKKRTVGATHAHFAQVNGLGLPFADGTFDAVTSFKFFHLVPDELKPTFIAEMARVTKPGGKVVIEFNSPYYGGVLAFYRYYFRKAKAGGMRQKCLFPDQVPHLFAGLTVRRRFGIKLPLAGALSKVVGERAVTGLNRVIGNIPGVRYLAYAILIEAEKSNPTNRRSR
jgi:ubiquinone/menaquinone biosynthesis C-methylase UbiE